MKSLVLAEKPSVGRDLARVLKCTSKRRGYIEGEKYIVTWSLGHLVTLAEPHNYNKSWKQWRMSYLPMMPDDMKLKVIRKTSKQFNTIKKLMKRNDVKELIIATDAGREGELVARWIMEHARWSKRKPFKRLWISSQTDEAILQGFENLKDGKQFDNLYDAAQCRAEADWLIGLNVTRALTLKHDTSLNAGRVQTPTLSIVVQREKEISDFTPVDFWKIVANFGDYHGTWRDDNGNSRIFRREKAEELSGNVNGQTGVIESVITKAKSQKPPLAYDLTELQRDANKRYGFSAKKTLSTLQTLYERHKLVTYPRTDSRYLSSDIVPTLKRRLEAISVIEYAKYVQPLLEQNLSPGKRLVNDSKVSDHHAIIPTEITPNFQRLTSDERSIYDLIVRRFIEVLYPPYKYDRIIIATDVNGEKFYASGKVEKDLGWRVISGNYDDDVIDEDEQDQVLGDISEGEKRDVQSVNLKQSQTRPPSRYTEASLLGAMESPGKFIDDDELRDSIKDRGLGTPATRADIIEKLIRNYYMQRKAKSLIPTPKGIELINIVPEQFKKPELTAEWELRLSNIAKGKESADSFMKDIRRNTREVVQQVKASNATYTPKTAPKEDCPMCGNPLMYINAKRGKKKLVCTDKRCGYEEFEGESGVQFGKKRSRKRSRMNKKLIRQYGDKSKGTNLGDLLKDALNKEE